MHDINYDRPYIQFEDVNKAFAITSCCVMSTLR